MGKMVCGLCMEGPLVIVVGDSIVVVWVYLVVLTFSLC